MHEKLTAFCVCFVALCIAAVTLGLVLSVYHYHNNITTYQKERDTAAIRAGLEQGTIPGRTEVYWVRKSNQSAPMPEDPILPPGVK